MSYAVNLIPSCMPLVQDAFNDEGNDIDSFLYTLLHVQNVQIIRIKHSEAVEKYDNKD